MDGDGDEMMREKRGYVYFIGADGYDAIKIGFSVRPMARIAQIQSGSPENLTVLHMVPAKKKVEALLHTLFSPSRVRGEWFGNVDAIRNFARHLEYCHSARVLRDLGMERWPVNEADQARFFDRFADLTVTEEQTARVAADVFPERSAEAGFRRRTIPRIEGWPAAMATIPPQTV